jgi:3',5'-nucleoside bisphosphate phosphatase
MLDLHCHTTYSDGTLTPQELVAAAFRAGVRSLAITDHDTMAGWDEAFAAATQYDGLEIVPGVELSTVHQGRSMHILGFYPDRSRLSQPLQHRLEERVHRAQAIVHTLQTLGYAIQLPTPADGTAPGRPHIAAALVEAGYVRSSEEAFDRLLGDRKPAYVNYGNFSAKDGIALLRSCGAVPIWAHPYLYRGGEVEDVLAELVDAGLMGVEVHHPNHTPTQRLRLSQLAAEYGLLVSGGSDYHGPAADSHRSQANRLNMMALPLSLLEPIKQAAQAGSL